MMDIEKFLELMLPEFIFGAEDGDMGGDDSTGGDSSDSGDTSDSDNQGDNGGDNEDDDSDDSSEDKSGDNDGRTKALKAERLLKRAAITEANKLRKENEDLKRASMDELTRTKAERDDATAKVAQNAIHLEKLTTGFRNSALKQAISAEATKLNFVDIDDALKGVDMTAIDVEQDEEDPSNVTIDVKTVTSAVKKLATAKPHFIKSGTSNGEPTGSQFGGSRKNSKSDDEDTLRMRYPSL